MKLFSKAILAAGLLAGAASLAAQGAEAPAFKLTQVADGKSFSLETQRGKLVLLDFWATWCPPCRRAIPHLKELQKKYGKEGLLVVGVSVDHAGEELLKNFVSEWKINYPVLLDKGHQVSRLYGGIRSLPTSFLIGKNGHLSGSPLVGYHSFEQYESLVKKALGKK